MNKLLLLPLGLMLGLGTARVTGADSLAVRSALDTAIQEEYRAQTTYQKVIETFGDVRPFSNIVRAEGQHVRELSDLFVRRHLCVPRSRYTDDEVPVYDDIVSACRGGIASELHTVALYDRLLKIELPPDVERVFENLRSASLERHLPAFRRCVGRGR